MRLLPILLFLTVLAAVPPCVAVAQTALDTTETPALKLERWDAEAALIEKVLAEERPGPPEIDGMRATLDAQRAATPQLIAATDAELEPLRQQLEALGAPPEDGSEEAPDVAAERKRLTELVASVEARQKRLAQANARAAALLDRLSTLRRELFTRELLTRAPSLFEPGVIGRAIASIGRVAKALGGETAQRIETSRLDVPFVLRTLLPVVLIGAALFLMLGVKRSVLRRLLGGVRPEMTHGRRVLTAFGVTLVRLVTPAASVALALLAVWNSGLVGELGEILLSGLAFTALIVTGAYALGGAYYAPHAPQLRLSRLSGSETQTAHTWLMVLAAVVGLDRVLVARGGSLGLSIEALELLNTGLLLAGGAVVWGFARFMGDRGGHAPATDTPPSSEEDADRPAERSEYSLAPVLRKAAGYVARASAIGAPGLALIGYFAASRFVFYPLVFSGAVIGFCVLLFHAVQDSVDRMIGPAEGEGGAGQSRIRLIPVAVAFLLICAAVPVLALIWGADATDLAMGWRSFSEGFHVGEVVIAPFDFFGFLIVFSIGYVLTRIVQGVLSRSVLPLTGLDSGAKAAIRAGIFYLGVFLSALVAISATGLDLSNLAIVAGALSVGIGFGLQNIVNNFVSGIILLIERPIKAGDWVELGSGMGYVKQVNVRSTEIETFDRASLIVPNSELISGPVTNWTHDNLNGRLIVPIGVAYGTDPRMVETILTEIARGHTMLLRRPAPYVLFRRFGADALEFEIRGVLRDVNWILNVTSDINFEIARRFAEAGIEIPFAQRDLHLRNAGEVGRAMGDAIRGAGAAGATEETLPPPPAPRRRRRRGGEAAGTEPDGDT